MNDGEVKNWGAARENAPKSDRAAHTIWPNFQCHSLTTNHNETNAVTEKCGIDKNCVIRKPVWTDSMHIIRWQCADDGVVVDAVTAALLLFNNGNIKIASRKS